MAGDGCTIAARKSTTTASTQKDESTFPMTRLWTRYRRRKGLVAVAVIVIMFVGEFSIGHQQTHRRQTNVTTAPNILLFILDQWRYDWDGMTPDTPNGPIPLRMPFLQAAASKGMRFTNALVPSPLCGPVRACLAAAKEYDETGVPANRPDDWPIHQDTFYKLLRDQSNYNVMTCGKDDLYRYDAKFPFAPFVLAMNANNQADLGFSHAIRTAGKNRVTKEIHNFDPYRKFLEATPGAFEAYQACVAGPDRDGRWPPDTKCTADRFVAEIYPDDFVTHQARLLIKAAANEDDDQPWFLQVNFPGPHFPHISTASMATSVADRTWPVPVGAFQDSHNSRTQCPQQQDGTKEGTPQLDGNCNYGAELEHLDRLMERIVEEVEHVNQLESTVVCITGDHGEMLGEHGQMGKKRPWRGSIGVPLVCFGPEIAAGLEYHDPVTTLDIPGTIMDYAGASPNSDMTSQSLRGVLSGHADQQNRTYWSSGLDHWRLVVQKVDGVAYKLVCCRKACQRLPGSVSPTMGLHGDWQMLLFDVDNDRYEMNPILDKPLVVDTLQKNLPRGWCFSGEN